MKLTPDELRTRENAIFDALEHAQNDETFLNRMYRDGVPTPKAYLAQRVRVVFVFREPKRQHGFRPRPLNERIGLRVSTLSVTAQPSASSRAKWRIKGESRNTGSITSRVARISPVVSRGLIAGAIR